MSCLYLEPNGSTTKKIQLLMYCNIVFMKRYTPTGLSLPADLMHRIDCERGDVPRSRYLLRIIEKFYIERQGDRK
jgi:hypothetical protein